MAEAYGEVIQLAQSIETSAAGVSPTATAAHTAAEGPGQHEVPQETAAVALQHRPGSTASIGTGPAWRGRADSSDAGERIAGQRGQDAASCGLQGNGATAQGKAAEDMPPVVVDLGMLADGAGGLQGGVPPVQGWLLRLSWT